MSNKFIVSAAHCFDGMNSKTLQSIVVFVGAHHSDDVDAQQFHIKSVTLHEHYNMKSYVNDIALIELDSSVNLTDPKIGIICLPKNDRRNYPSDQSIGFLAGWGRIGENESMSSELQQVQLPVMNETNLWCSFQVFNERLQFCAGYTDGGKDTCQGDRLLTFYRCN